jgi:hypothetical protein
MILRTGLGSQATFIGNVEFFGTTVRIKTRAAPEMDSYCVSHQALGIMKHTMQESIFRAGNANNMLFALA